MCTKGSWFAPPADPLRPRRGRLALLLAGGLGPHPLLRPTRRFRPRLALFPPTSRLEGAGNGG